MIVFMRTLDSRSTLPSWGELIGPDMLLHLTLGASHKLILRAFEPLLY